MSECLSIKSRIATVKIIWLNFNNSRSACPSKVGLRPNHLQFPLERNKSECLSIKSRIATIYRTAWLRNHKVCVGVLVHQKSDCDVKDAHRYIFLNISVGVLVHKKSECALFPKFKLHLHVVEQVGILFLITNSKACQKNLCHIYTDNISLCQYGISVWLSTMSELS